ncbi:unnamed protein product, partial [Brugia timori]|uniref:SUZ domain-containing protein n=1 Tax=Brugia timori TaxID=42155 RepID=A0A0R3R9C0_9BILA
ADGGITGTVIPPPAVVVPTLSSGTPVTIAQPQLVIPPPLTANPTPYPAFFPHHSIPATAVVNPTSLSGAVAGLAPPQPVQSATTVLQQYSASVEKRNSMEDEEDNSFNINKMLEQITAKVKKDNAMDGLHSIPIFSISWKNNQYFFAESPASPPMFNPDAVADENALTIPETNIRAWKLHPVDDIPSPQTNIDSQILQMSLTDAGLRNDPRIKKALASQFDAFTNSLMNAAPPSLPQPAQIFVQQSNATASISATQSIALSVLPKEESSASRLAGPRISTVNRDPRKRITVSDPRVTTVADSRLVSTTTPTLDPRLAPPNSLIQIGQIPSTSTSTSRAGIDNVYGAAVQVTIQNRDQDHRLHLAGYENSFMEEHNAERIGSYESRRSSGGNWMPQIRAAVDPRQVKRYVIGGYRSDSSQDRDERAMNRARREGTKSPSNNSAAAGTTTIPQAPLSLREKRKNNEYESPLSRIPEKTRWT